MPLKNTRVIPRRWQEANAPFVLGGMEAVVRISRPAELGQRNTDTGRTPQIPQRAYYEGPARIQSRGGLAPAAGDAGRPVAVGNYLVATPLDLGDAPRLGDVVDVLSSPDALEVGTRLYVVDVPTASVILQRNLGCDLTAPARPK